MREALTQDHLPYIGKLNPGCSSCNPIAVCNATQVWQNAMQSYFSFAPRSFKGESGLFLTPVLKLWGDGHIDRHVWRWVIVPSDLARTFGTVCAHYRMIHSTITIMRAWFKSTREKQLTLAWWASYEKISRYMYNKRIWKLLYTFSFMFIFCYNCQHYM